MKEQTRSRANGAAPPNGQPALLQRKCACGDKCDDCKKDKEEKKNVLQRFGGDRAPTTGIPQSVSNVLRTPGRPLDSATRARLEPRFGFDFSTVKIHADEPAHHSAHDVGALAYTVGQDVAFSSGHYRPGTASGDSLLAHELAHVVQQSGGGTSSSSSALEADADRSADLLTKSDQPAGPRLRAATRLSMKPDPANGSVPPSIDGVLRSPGEPLDGATRTRMERRFGFDFSAVRVHADPSAHESTRDVDAAAWTVGRDVAFAADHYRPDTPDGDSLLAHELGHVVQQRGVDGSGPIALGSPSDSAELDADDDASMRDPVRTLRRAPKKKTKKTPPASAPTTAPASAPAVTPEDPARILIAPVADFVPLSTMSTSNVKVEVRDAAVKSIGWELTAPDGALLPGAFKTNPTDADALTRPFQLQASQFPVGFTAGRHLLTCTGYSDTGAPVVKGTRDFNVLAAGVGTNAPVTGKHGTFTFTEYEKEDDSTAAITGSSVRVQLAFTPKDTVGCSDIVFVQAAQILNVRGESLLSKDHPEMDVRSTPMKWSIDQKESFLSPYYLSSTDPIMQTTFDDKRYGTVGHPNAGTDATPATLGDRPGGLAAGSRHFESCAMCRSGTDVGMVYACATWGYSRKLTGEVTMMPRGVSDSPSWVFKAAAESWNKWNKDKPVTPARTDLPALKP